ncbi:non-specific lipid-transfer protein-like protein At2g13820 [Vigna unguiculata]|uniref:non-specific lipid-transfer protein-like protein At2g13820 n=1 Tax=Vigna unguiculata TaxID=3917 RepID=UPI001016D700|nr:non-specific lipid-transfer protein-like protein At2g13820 [Vigna unguiculata]
MAEERMKMSVVLVMMSMLCAGAAAQSSSCTNALVSLSPCLNYIAGNSSTPSSECCSKLATVVSSQPQCLCEVLNGGTSSLGITINQTQALALPTACNVQTPPTTQCKAASPAESPNSNPSGTGSTNVPTTDNGSSGANSDKFSVPLLFLVLASTFATLIR